MDFDFNYTPLLFISLLSFIALLVVIYNRLYPELISRFCIRRNIITFLYGKDYQLIENIKINTTDGQTLTIKQLLVSRYGLFIINTCHYRGVIYGSNHQVKWLSRTIMHASTFINPSMDSRQLCEQLAKYLHLSSLFCDVINVFTGNSQLPSSVPKNTCKVDSLIRTISQHRTVCINPGLLPDIATVLKNGQKESQLFLKKVQIN